MAQPGRPRSEQARRTILAAAAKLVARNGYGELTMEGIATEAGVSKQTIYRWWSTKAEVVLEAVNEGAAEMAAVPDSGSLADDLRLFLRRTVDATTPVNRRLLASLMAAAQLDDQFAKSFRTGFLASRRRELRGMLARAQERGEIAASVDLDQLVEVVYALLWYRILVQHGPLDRRFGRQVADSVLRLSRAA
ncbi:MAG: TetR/AcrR family transcriptional regulator [Actinobacteria bacterium]|nr:TetR/AcrR family transcriptional regulator [Actinomycetota bacterium]